MNNSLSFLGKVDANDNLAIISIYLIPLSTHHIWGLISLVNKYSTIVVKLAEGRLELEGNMSGANRAQGSAASDYQNQENLLQRLRGSLKARPVATENQENLPPKQAANRTVLGALQNNQRNKSQVGGKQVTMLTGSCLAGAALCCWLHVLEPIHFTMSLLVKKYLMLLLFLKLNIYKLTNVGVCVYAPFPPIDRHFNINIKVKSVM